MRFFSLAKLDAHLTGCFPALADCHREKISLFVSAVGVPPKWVVDTLHTAGRWSVVFV